MKKVLLVVFLLATLVVGKANAQGIDFQHISYDEALKLAKEQDKLIFIDFYTEWCGPCKKLAAGPFMEQKNGDFFNKNFINIKLDAEKEGKAAATTHKVYSFPTLLFVNGDGNIVHKGVGVTFGEDLIGFGQDALNAANSQYSWEKLQALFPQKQDDEHFLKIYIQKMKEFGSNAELGIEAWLKVQTEIKEPSAEMMHYLLKNRSDLGLGGKAEEIFVANYDQYLTLATDNEKRELSRFHQAMMLNTLAKARKSANPELMKVVIDRTKDNEDLKPRRGDDLNTYQMDYYLFSADYTAFKRLAESYVDSLINLESIRDIKAEDEKFYNSFAKGKKEGEDKAVDIMLQIFKEGKIANDRVESIVETGQKYLTHIDTKDEYKTLNKWIEYCYDLIPGKYWVDNLKADMLYRQGKTKDAIELKTSAVGKMPYTVKKKVNYEHELELMKKGDKL